MNGKMTAMSVFNSKMPAQSIPVFNSWDAQASQKGIERAAEKITGAIDKTTGKLSGDIQKSTEKLVAATKDGAEKVSDSVKRVTTNASSMSAPVKAVHAGLHSVAESVNRLAEYLGEHPDEMGAATEAAESVGSQFRALVECAVQYERGTSQLNGQVGEMDKTADWIDCRFPQTERIQSSAMPLSDSFDGATLPGVFNTAATAPPIVSSFNELFGG